MRMLMRAVTFLVLSSLLGLTSGQVAQHMQFGFDNTTDSTSKPKHANPPSINSYGTQLSYAQYLSSGPLVGMSITTWPFRTGPPSQLLNQGHLTEIPICYVDFTSWDKLNCKIRQATNLWLEALGGVAGPDSGHSLAFRTKEKHQVKYCCKEYTYDGDKCVWDEGNWPKDALAIYWKGRDTMETPAYASTGYWAESKDPAPGRHYIHITDDATIRDVAHEFGHVLGMAHEHQRWDRDEYIQFRCHNLGGMSAAVYHYQERNPGVTEEAALKSLCEDADLAHQYDAPSLQYIKGAFLDPVAQPEFDGPGGLDMNSIMMYGTFGGVKRMRFGRPGLDEAVLIKIAKDADGKVVPAVDWEFESPQKPSPKDASFVKRFYPWDQDRWDKNHPVKAAS